MDFVVFLLFLTYSLYVAGYTYQFISFHRNNEPAFFKFFLALMTYPLMFVTIPFLLGLIGCVHLLREVTKDGKEDE